MKILHTADLHIGQVLYQRYDRVEEHDHFFGQLRQWCIDEKPDALIVAGDVFDISLVSAATKRQMTDYFVAIHHACPEMKIVITAGNHDSASRLEAEKSIWDIANVTVVGIAPSADETDMERFVVETEAGFIIALPFVNTLRENLLQSLLDHVAERNREQKPVVVMAHTTLAGADVTGHDFEIGTIRTTELSAMGSGYDYIALGHIHKPQTIGHEEDCMLEEVTYPAGVARYSGSALHVSCDENYPHSVSVVDIDHHGGNVTIRQLRINELLHFMILPEKGSFADADDAIAAISEAVSQGSEGYFRLRIDRNTMLPSTFLNDIAELIGNSTNFRFNPKHIWTGEENAADDESSKPQLDVATLQQMNDPLDFVKITMNQYPDLHLTIDEIGEMFAEVEQESRK